ncbi:kinase-like protein [Choiromyces venosus 120613-1]|uniref:Kinase-like protein n=1 Tax=Choiromyces venosus 120613-1 TaxID=1336337 RepID=A0A3N4JVA8_9PEZI|nr:kinase-like protein [Choiromyces venosus 120613-1]
MSFSAPSVSTPSPLSALNRPARQRRQSPPLQTSLRSSPLPSHRTNPSDNIDDSDDEGGKAPQLSALARMLLDDFPESNGAASAKEALADAPPLLPEPVSSNGGHSPRDRMDWSHSPVADEYKTGQLGSFRMSPDFSTARELVTPAPGRYSRKVFNGTYSTISSSGSSSNSSEPKQDNENRAYGTTYGSVVRPTTASTMANTQASTSASAIRWKRAGRGLLGGLAGPPRRGPRRDSERGDEEYHDGYIGEGVEGRSSPSSTEKEERESDANSGSREYSTNTSEDVDMEPPMLMSRRSRRSSPVSSAEKARINVYRGSNTPEESGTGGRSSPAEFQKRSGSSSSSNSMSRAAAIAAAAAALPQSVVVNDKENMLPPPTFRRPTANNSYKRLGSSEEKPAPAPVSPVKYQIKSFVPSPAKVSPPPKNNVLSTRSNNTPLRPAPPPPKMSMLEAVTASAGASATASQQSSRRQRSVVHVNGKPYRRLDAIGKGGSSKVYKVMAENFKMLAMKKVTFSSQDGEAAIRGYKGEIDLLRKLSGVDRVIRLYDWEVNDEKQCLTMLMECGETDLAKVLTLRHGHEDSRMDVSFIRHYWREMLLCVQSVHDLNIIHSDLKPANFLLVQGRLKLIDFGIANAIQDDTVNIHRESQVGTLNYMSPEAIVDINATSGKAMASVGAPRLMKLGAPSDVWSLGCMLYQMTYGRGPFSHLSLMYQKINAIPDPNYPIEYPDTGIGGVLVPRSLVNTISACLARNKDERPTIRQLLSDDDPFLNPDRVKEGLVDVSMDMLRLLLENAVDHVTEKGVPTREITAAWAKDVYGKLERRMVETRRR